MTITTLRRYAGALERARRNVMRVVAATSSGLQRNANSRRTSGRDPEIDAIEAEIDALIADQESHTLAEIDAALRTLREHPEAFGYCDVCGAEIDRDRLDLAPWASCCGVHRTDPG